jgi:hypothetical protein
MKYLLQIYSGGATSEFERLSEDEQNAIVGEYLVLGQLPAVIGGDQLQPVETATTVRVENGLTLLTDGPFVEAKEYLGGYLRVDADDLDVTAVAAIYTTPEEEQTHQAWVDEGVDALRQSDTGAYVNFVSDEGESGVRAAYPGDTWKRLAEIKRRYDPTNLFHMNQNIPPA